MVAVLWLTLGGMKVKQLPPVGVLREMFEYHPDGYLVRRKDDKRGRGRRGKGERVGCINKGSGYYQVGIGLERYQVHRVIYAMHHTIDDTKMIDHIDGDRGNNRIENLRQVNMTENLLNAKVAKNNTSGVTGVRWNKSQQRWLVSVKVRGKTIWLGTFKDKKDAIDKRLSYERLNGLYPRRHAV